VSDETRAEYRPTIKDLPADERPRERLEHAGETALSTTELLAIILRTGVGGESVLDMGEGQDVTTQSGPGTGPPDAARFPGRALRRALPG